MAHQCLVLISLRERRSGILIQRRKFSRLWSKLWKWRDDRTTSGLLDWMFRIATQRWNLDRVGSWNISEYQQSVSDSKQEVSGRKKILTWNLKQSVDQGNGRIDQKQNPCHTGWLCSKGKLPRQCPNLPSPTPWHLSKTVERELS